MVIVNYSNLNIIDSFIEELSSILESISSGMVVGVYSEEDSRYFELSDDVYPIAYSSGIIFINRPICERCDFTHEEFFALLLHEIVSSVLNINNGIYEVDEFKADDFVCNNYDESHLVSALYKELWNCEFDDDKQRRVQERIARINIRRWSIPMPKQDYMVVIQCSTYNHESYIEDALKGFIMQKTTYPFCALVTDDCSTDGTAEIIKRYALKYPDIIIPILLGENHMQHKKSRDPYIVPWHNRAKYLAICEGDDYWCDPLKLQKQVDFLENNLSVNIAVHNAMRVYPDMKKELFNRDLKTGVYNLRQCLYKRWFTPSASFLFRNNHVRSELWKINGSNGDMAELYTNLLIGDLFYSSEVMSVYNYRTPSSLSTSTPKRVLYKKKIGMLKTINQLSNNRYLFYTLPLFLYIRVKQLINWLNK